MKRKSKLDRMLERVGRGWKTMMEELFHGPAIEGFGRWFRIIVTTVLAIVVSHAIAFDLNLSEPIRYLVMIVLCVVVMTTVTIKPRLVLTVVCVMILFLGVSFTVSSMTVDNTGEKVWDTGLLGVGVSLVALAAAVYVLQDQVGRKGDGVSISGSERVIRDSRNGYAWVVERRKYRCEYCRDSGRYRYHRTLSGIKKHIEREHVQRKMGLK